jgi:hypothetical protein
MSRLLISYILSCINIPKKTKPGMGHPSSVIITTGYSHPPHLLECLGNHTEEEGEEARMIVRGQAGGQAGKQAVGQAKGKAGGQVEG